MIATKVCTKCGGDPQPLTNFYRRGKGHQSTCAVCDNRARAARARKAGIVGGTVRSCACGLTQEEIGERLGLSRQRIAQIEQSAMAKMRAAIAAGWR